MMLPAQPVYQEDGKLVLAGRMETPFYNHFAITRYNPDGSLDSTFNGTGILSHVAGAGWGWAHAVTMDNSNRIVALGRAYSVNSYNAVVARYTTNGSLDAGFSGDGVQSAVNMGGAEFGRGVRHSIRQQNCDGGLL